MYETRLEAATSRLEDMAISFDGTSPTAHGNVPVPIQPAVPEPPKQVVPPPAPAPEPEPPQIEDFDELIKSDVQAFVDLGKKIGGLVGEQVCYRRKRLESKDLTQMIF